MTCPGSGRSTPGLHATVEAYLGRTLGLSDQDVQDLLRVGAANVRACLEGARRASSLSETAVHAHALKGNLVNMGLPDLAARAKALEAAAKEGSADLADDLLSRLESELCGF